MLQVMRDHVSTTRRLDAAASIAKDAAPYMHPPKLSFAVEHSGPTGTTVAPPVLNVQLCKIKRIIVDR